MTLGCGAEFEDMHGFARVHVHEESHPVGQRDCVRCLLRKRLGKCLMETRRPLHGPVELPGQPGVLHVLGHHVAVVG